MFALPLRSAGLSRIVLSSPILRHSISIVLPLVYRMAMNMHSEEYKWPPKCQLFFRSGRGGLFFDSTERDLDLADRLMLHWQGNSRTVYFGLTTASKTWKTWDTENVETIERLIRYDLNFDGYYVNIKRVGNVGLPCTEEFTWKLLICPM